jgi:hypothetical protein
LTYYCSAPLKMSTRKIPGSKAGRCVRVTTYHLLVQNVKKIRGLSLPDPHGPVQACSGTDLLFTTVTQHVHTFVRYMPWRGWESWRVQEERQQTASMWDSRAITWERAGNGTSADKPNNEQLTDLFCHSYNFTLKPAPMAQRGSSGMPVLFLQPQCYMGWVVNATLRPLYALDRDPVPTLWAKFHLRAYAIRIRSLSFHRFSSNSYMLNSITCRTFIQNFNQNRTIIVENKCKN